MAGRVTTIAGAKGGVGKTTTSINLGAVLAERGHSVVIVELDLAMANLADFLGIDLEGETARTFHDVLAGDARLVDAIHTRAENLDVLPSGLELESYVTADVHEIERVVDTLRADYDVVVLDTMAGLSDETILPLELADGAVLVSTPYRAAVRDTRKTNELAELIGTPVLGIVFTKAGSAPGPTPERIADHLGIDLLGVVEDDRALPASQFEGEPVIAWAPDGEAAAAYRRAGERVEDRLAGLPERPRDELTYTTRDLTTVEDLIGPIEEDDEFWWGGTPDDDRATEDETAGTDPAAGTEEAIGSSDAAPETTDTEAETEPAPGDDGGSSVGGRLRRLLGFGKGDG